MNTDDLRKVPTPSVQQADNTNSIENSSPAESAEDSNKAKRSTGFISKFWPNRSTITVSFMEDLSDKLKYRVERVIRRWEPHMSLAMEFVEGRQANIRISLNGMQNRSELGNNALYIPADIPTLTLATPSDHPSFEPDLLHEFGHALGLNHEHQHPDANIPWDMDRTYRYFKERFGWDENDVNSQIFEVHYDADVFRGSYDKKSIMHYQVPNEITLGDWEVGVNTTISEQDKINLRKIYPSN